MFTARSDIPLSISQIPEIILNVLGHFLFLYPLKTSEDQKFFNVFRVYRKEIFA